MSIRTITELRKLLEELEEQGLGDYIPRIAHQPNWPLAHNLQAAVTSDQLKENQEDDIDEDEEELTPRQKTRKRRAERKSSAEFEKTLWLVASEGNCSEHPYAPKDLWNF